MKLHNAMWPGVVGKDDGSDQPTISLDKMLDLTASASIDGQKFDGVDLFLFHPGKHRAGNGLDRRAVGFHGHVEHDLEALLGPLFRDLRRKGRVR